MAITSSSTDNDFTDTDGQERLTEIDRLPTEIDAETLRKYFTLTESDLAQVHQCLGILNKPGFAVLLCTLRWRGSFLRSMQDLSHPVLETVTTQMESAACPTEVHLHQRPSLRVRYGGHVPSPRRVA